MLRRKPNASGAHALVSDEERLFRIYLQDHLAVLRGAVELAHRVKQQCDEEWAREAATRFLGGVIEDRKELLRVARDLGVEPSLAKEAGAWLGQKLGGLKLNGRVFSRSPLSTLVEMEGMCMLAAHGEAAWRALEPLAEARPELGLHPKERARAARKLREALLDALPLAGEHVFVAKGAPRSSRAVSGTRAPAASGDAASPS